MIVTGKKICNCIKYFCAVIIVAAVYLPVFADSSYTVQRGDTLYSISRKYQLTVAELRTANNLTDEDVIKAGQRLVIPSADISNAAALSTTPDSDHKTEAVPGGTYTVVKGDTLYGIARKYNMKLAELLSLNNMGSDAVIKSGQKIIVNGITSAAGLHKDDVPVKTSPDRKNGNDDVQKSVSSSLMWPVADPSITYIKGKVSGVELSAKKNEQVKSIRAGTVMYTGMYRGYGRVVFVESKTGLIYAYSWLGAVSVRKGDYVVCGDPVGTAGRDPDTGRPRLSFMVFKNGMPMDPAEAPRG
ncbi:MAG: M23 family metallopeptidase [Treponema sp.]|nr:M23 family metallopeptidase [Treponema sp.]